MKTEDNVNMTEFLKLWLRKHRRGMILAVIVFLIFLGSFALYHLPVKAVIYPAVLCAMIGIAFLAADFRRARTTCKQLSKIRTAADLSDKALPFAEGAEDGAYQEVIRLLCDEQRRMQTAMERRYSDMVDYYTVWAHQIKTPISSMRLNLQNEDSPFSRKVSLDLFRIEQYVEMVMMFLRLNSESSDYVIREYDLDQIVRRSVKKFAGEFINRRLSLIYEPLETRVITDEKWLSFVIEQVLSNALKYTTAGSISILMDPPGTLCIRDTGIGIAPEDLPRIFEKGYTGYNGRADKSASGIGLYLCRRICGNLGHGISAESAPGKGTAIRIDLNQVSLERE